MPVKPVGRKPRPSTKFVQSCQSCKREHGPLVTNVYACGCKVFREFRGAEGRHIEWCALHHNADLLRRAALAVHDAFASGRNPTFEQLDKLKSALFATEASR